MAQARTPRQSWIEEGLHALAAGGPGAVRIEPLARALGVTKGGFYWYFDNRQALLDEMLDAWESISVDEVIERVERDEGNARVRLDRLFRIARSGDRILTIDLAVRDWARRDERVARRLSKVDARRLDFMRELFGEFVSDPEEIEIRCLYAYALFLGTHFMTPDFGERSRDEVLEMALSRLET